MDDAKIFAAIEAYDNELSSWRIHEFAGYFMTDDLARVTKLTDIDLTKPEPATATFHRYEFADKETAKSFIRFQAMKAALETLNA